MKIATLGPEFSYCDSVVKKKFGEDSEVIYCSSISKIFEVVSADKTCVGIVPVENTVGGSVRETIVLLRKYKVKINGAYDLGIHHCFACKGENFTKIISHPQSIIQCGKFLEKYREEGLEILECSSNSKAMEIASGEEDYAAIGPLVAARFYGLNVLREGVEDNDNNTTRFFLISHNESLKGNKTSMVIEPREDRPGLLFEILAVFKIKGINLTKIESIPTGRGIGSYIFYIDIDGGLEDENVFSAIDFLKTIVDVYLFGSYGVEKI